MNILLTGATGFIGSNLLKRLRSRNHQVAIIARPGSDQAYIADVPGKIDIFEYRGEFADLLMAIQKVDPEVVIHVASLFLAQHNQEDVARLVESNIKFPTQLLEAMRLSGVKHFINTGTSWQHYMNQVYSPVNLYAASKQAFESLMQFYAEAYDLRVLTLKLFDTYGPGDRRNKLFSLLRNATRSGMSLRMSNGFQEIDMVYVDDVIDAYECAIEQIMTCEPQSCFAVASGKRILLRDLVKVYTNVVGIDLKIDWGAMPYRQREVMLPWTEFQTIPGWRAKVELSEGIYKMERDKSINGLLS